MDNGFCQLKVRITVMDFQPMSPEEIQRRMQFLLDQQARFDTQIEQLSGKVDRMADGLVGLTGIVGRLATTVDHFAAEHDRATPGGARATGGSGWGSSQLHPRRRIPPQRGDRDVRAAPARGSRQQAVVGIGRVHQAARHRRLSSRLLEEEPAVTLAILRAISPARWVRLDLRQNRCPRRFGSCEVLSKVVHVNENAIDNPGHGRPPTSLLAHLPVSFRPLIVGRRRRQHDQSVTGRHLAVGESPVRRGKTHGFAEAECAVKPVEGRHPIFVGDHRNYAWCNADGRRLGGGTALRCRRLSTSWTAPGNGAASRRFARSSG